MRERKRERERERETERDRERQTDRRKTIISPGLCHIGVVLFVDGFSPQQKSLYGGTIMLLLMLGLQFVQ